MAKVKFYYEMASGKVVANEVASSLFNSFTESLDEVRGVISFDKSMKNYIVKKECRNSYIMSDGSNVVL
jgi:hypothetical protein